MLRNFIEIKVLLARPVDRSNWVETNPCPKMP